MIPTQPPNLGKVATAVSCIGTWLILGFAGYQIAGWTGAILLPIGVTVVVAIVAGPLLVLLFVLVLIRDLQKAGRTVRQFINSKRPSARIDQ